MLWMMMMAAAVPGAVVQPARPVVPPVEWITQDDYPAAALAKRLEGAVRVELTIGRDGAVSTCKVLSSSGTDLLDVTTCAVLKLRARFDPARDGAGNTVPSTWYRTVRWVVPKETLIDVSDLTEVLRNIRPFDGSLSFTVGKDGRIGNCAITASLPPPDETQELCAQLAAMPSFASMPEAARFLGKQVTFRFSLEIR